MKQRIRVIISVAVSFTLVAALVQNYRRQHEIENRLAKMQKMIQRASASHSSKASKTMAPIILSGGTGGPKGILKQRDLEEVLSTGWKLVDQRSPERAAEAVRLFNYGITNIDPKSPELYNGLGRALLIAGKPRQAIAAWRRGLALAPHFSDMQSGIGWAYWWLNDPCRARMAWQKAQAMNPHSLDAWSAMAWIDLALGEYVKAKVGFETLVNSDPERKPWIMGLAMAQARNGDIKQISQFFPLPPLERFEQPLPFDPTSALPRKQAVGDDSYHVDSSKEAKQ